MTGILKEKPLFIIQDNKPTAVILDINDYKELLEHIEDIEDLSELKKMREKKLNFRSFDEFLGEM